MHVIIHLRKKFVVPTDFQKLNVNTLKTFILPVVLVSHVERGADVKSVRK